MQHASEDQKCVQTFSQKTQRKEIILKTVEWTIIISTTTPQWALAFIFGKDGILNYII